jgi:hypothetical protein
VELAVAGGTLDREWERGDRLQAIAAELLAAQQQARPAEPTFDG